MRTRWLPALWLATLAGCAPEMDPPSEVKTLRVLAVQKDKPYTRPGEGVRLTMLLEDPDEPRPLQILWYGGCRNPPGDLFYRCFENVEQLGAIGSGRVFDLAPEHVPADIIATRPPPPDPRFPRYGLIYVFFAACAGRIDTVTPSDELAFPLRCLDAAGEQLGPDDFVAGYTAIYVYDGFTNDNPTPTGFLVRGEPMERICVDAECLPPEVPPDPPPEEPPSCDAADPAPDCVKSCEEDGEGDCPEIPIQPIIAETEAEGDAISAVTYGREVGEQMWINYYVDRGGVGSVARLLNDALAGWNSDYGTTFQAPKQTGPVKVWAVIHDNRGGVGWVQTTLRVY